MARIVGVDLPKNKRGEIGLTYIYGIGRSTARKILGIITPMEHPACSTVSDDQEGGARMACQYFLNRHIAVFIRYHQRH